MEDIDFYKRPVHQKSLISYFIRKTVLVETGDYAVLGRLIRFEEGSRPKHIPQTLILHSLTNNWIIIRTWQTIKSVPE